MRTSTLLPVVAYLAFSGSVSAAPVAAQDGAIDRRWCLFGFGTSCDDNKPAASSAVSSAKVVSSSAKASSTVASSSAVKSSAVASKVVSSVAAAASATSWSQCKEFDWTSYKGWTWGGGFTLQYVQDWYVDNYGFNPPQGMSWNQVSSLVNKFGVSTTVAAPKTTSKYSKGCSNPWTAVPTSSTKAVVATTTSKAVVTSSVKSSASASSSSAVKSSAAASASKSSASASASATGKPAGPVGPGPVGPGPAVPAPASSAASSSASASSTAAPVVVVPASSASSSASSSSAAAPIVVAPASSASSSASAAVTDAAAPVATDATAPAPVATDTATDTAAPAAGTPGSGTGTPGTGAGSDSASASSTSTAAPVATNSPSINGYSYGGCAQEITGRLLPSVQTSSSSQSIESCTALCLSHGFAVAGLEYGSECYCGSVEDTTTALVSGECYMPCSGNDKEICGGPNAINYYINPDVKPATVILPPGWTTYGVVNEGTGGRALTTQLWSSQDNTIQSCAQGCFNAGFSVSGTEFSSECYCGNGFSNGGGALIDSSSAFMKCSGDIAQMCGGPSILSVVSSFGQNIPSI